MNIKYPKYTLNTIPTPAELKADRLAAEQAAVPGRIKTVIGHVVTYLGRYREGGLLTRQTAGFPLSEAYLAALQEVLSPKDWCVTAAEDEDGDYAVHIGPLEETADPELPESREANKVRDGLSVLLAQNDPRGVWIWGYPDTIIASIHDARAPGAEAAEMEALGWHWDDDNDRAAGECCWVCWVKGT